MKSYFKRLFENIWREIFKILIFCRKNLFLSKIWIFMKNYDICRKNLFLSKIWIFMKNYDICRKFGLFLVICIFVANLDFCRKFVFLLQNLMFVKKFHFFVVSKKIFWAKFLNFHGSEFWIEILDNEKKFHSSKF